MSSPVFIWLSLSLLLICPPAPVAVSETLWESLMWQIYSVTSCPNARKEIILTMCSASSWTPCSHRSVSEILTTFWWAFSHVWQICSHPPWVLCWAWHVSECVMDECWPDPRGRVHGFKGQKARVNQEGAVPTRGTTSWAGSCYSGSPGLDTHIMSTQ